MDRAVVTKMVNIFLDGLVSSGNDAGWSGENLLAKIIAFGGDIPRGSGQDQSNATMIQALDAYRSKHHDFPAIEQGIWRLLHNAEHRRHVLALLVNHYYRGIDDRTDRTYDQAAKIGRWVEHCNRFPWQDNDLIHSSGEEIIRKYQYSIYKRGPKLILCAI